MIRDGLIYVLTAAFVALLLALISDTLWASIGMACGLAIGFVYGEFGNSDRREIGGGR